MFTRRHYEAIAKLMADTRPKENPILIVQWQLTLASLTTLFKNDNQHFDADRFRKAANA